MLTIRHYASIAVVMVLCCLDCTAEARPDSARRALAVLCPKRVSLAPVFEKAAERYGLPAGLLVAVARNESNCNPSAVGRGGEIGLGQIRPGTLAAGNVPIAHLYRPEVNARMMARHLAACLLLCGDIGAALGVYAGHRTCSQGRASGYARRVLRFWNEVKGEPRT